jgi:hypothetical protein
MPASDTRPGQATNVTSPPGRPEFSEAPPAQPSYEIVTTDGRRFTAGGGRPQFAIQIAGDKTA